MLTIFYFILYYISTHNPFSPKKKESRRLELGGKRSLSAPYQWGMLSRAAVGKSTFAELQLSVSNPTQLRMQTGLQAVGAVAWVGRWKLCVPAVGGIFLTSISKARSSSLLVMVSVFQITASCCNRTRTNAIAHVYSQPLSPSAPFLLHFCSVFLDLLLWLDFSRPHFF